MCTVAGEMRLDISSHAPFLLIARQHRLLSNIIPPKFKMSARNKFASLMGDVYFASGKKALTREGIELPTLENKNCIVTGGSRGIGAAIASRFAAEGANVTIVGRNPERLKVAKEKLNMFRGSVEQKLRTFEGDVTKEESWSELFKTVVCFNIKLESC
jgi:hypothetical protein